MYDEHGVTMLEQDMQEVIRITNSISNNLDKIQEMINEKRAKNKFIKDGCLNDEETYMYFEGKDSALFECIELINEIRVSNG